MAISLAILWLDIDFLENLPNDGIETIVKGFIHRLGLLYKLFVFRNLKEIVLLGTLDDQKNHLNLLRIDFFDQVFFGTCDQLVYY